MAGEATDYDIITEVNLLDGIINAFVGSATIYCRTVTVLKYLSLVQNNPSKHRCLSYR